MKRHWLFSNRSNSTKASKLSEFNTSYLSNNLQFWLLLVFGVSSLMCSLCIIYRYLSNRIMRNALHNHAILLLIIINVILIVTDVSWMLDALRHAGRITTASSAFCLIWWLIDYSLYSMQTVILAWASIERHILIFHSNLVTTRKQKLIYHYLPPFILILYVFIFYASVLLFPPCKNEFVFSEIECGRSPCYLDINVLVTWDGIVNSIFPTLIIAIFNIALIYRIIAQKKRLRQPIQWRKHRRMSIQLLSISAVYLFLNLPMAIFMLVQLIQQQDSTFGFGAQLYIFFITYSVTLSLPFVVFLNCLLIDKQHRAIKIAPAMTTLQQRRTAPREVATIE